MTPSLDGTITEGSVLAHHELVQIAVDDCP